MPDPYQALLERIKVINKLRAVEELLEWDQLTHMPPKGVGARAEMKALLAALRHERQTSPEIGDLLEQSSADGDPVRATNIRETRRLYERAVKVPSELVKELARTASLGNDIWTRARADSDFKAFAPTLSKLLGLKRQEAEYLGYENEPYDALLDEFEPGATAEEIAGLFAELRGRLVPLVQAIAEARQRPDFSILKRHYPRAAQETMGRKFAEEMGFDFDAGRLDVSVHPFTISMSCDDVRMTTRYDEHYMPSAVFGVLHEAGHSLYEQGCDPQHAFTPMGSCVSLGIHESQSRMWENQVGRSRPFWEHHYPWARELYPEALGNVGLDEFYAAINTVAPSLIRVEADELTYNLHIIVRFELERDLVSGRLEVADIPDAWNRKMTKLVGITPGNDAEGCLQDTHWSGGAFGYFPTYALGNLYAAQFFAAAREALGDLGASIRGGNLRPLNEWLRTHIHRHGMRYRAGELVRLVTGKPLSIEPFMTYVNAKFKPIYGLP